MIWQRKRQRLPRRAHIIDNDTVGCPRRQVDVDIGQCLACDALQDLVVAETDGVSYLVCSGSVGRALAAEPYPRSL